MMCCVMMWCVILCCCVVWYGMVWCDVMSCVMLCCVVLKYPHVLYRTNLPTECPTVTHDPLTILEILLVQTTYINFQHFTSKKYIITAIIRKDINQTNIYDTSTTITNTSTSHVDTNITFVNQIYHPLRIKQYTRKH